MMSQVVPYPNINQTEICLDLEISQNWTHSDPEEHLFSRMQLLHFQWQCTVTSLIELNMRMSLCICNII